MKYFYQGGIVKLVAILAAGAAYADNTRILPAPTRAAVDIAPYITLRLKTEQKSSVSVNDIVNPNARIATYTIAPRTGVKALSATTFRRDVFPNILPAETQLFEVSLGELTGYCAPIVVGQGIRESQCFVDLNADSTFDASYRTLETVRGQKMYLGRMVSIAPVPQLRFTQIDNPSFSTETLVLSFKRIRNNQAEFHASFGDQRESILTQKCTIDGQSKCLLGGTEFVFAREGERLKVISMAQLGSDFEIASNR